MFPSDPIWLFVACVVILEAMICAWIAGPKRIVGAMIWSAAAIVALFLLMLALRDERDLFFEEYVTILAPEALLGLPLGTAIALVVARFRRDRR